MSEDTEKGRKLAAPSGGKEWMKAYSTVLKGDKRVYSGGGAVLFKDDNGGNVRMVPGQVRRVPDQVVQRFNRPGYPPVFVRPGSQIDGKPAGPVPKQSAEPEGSK